MKQRPRIYYTESQELLKHLRRTRAMRRSRHHTQKKENHGRIADAVSIRERPAAAKDQRKTSKAVIQRENKPKGPRLEEQHDSSR